jgi:hypothetical protein
MCTLVWESMFVTMYAHGGVCMRVYACIARELNSSRGREKPFSRIGSEREREREITRASMRMETNGHVERSEQANRKKTSKKSERDQACE